MKKTEILFHRYELTAKAPLNAATTRKKYPGALILVEGGVGCIHPWPEFGDAPLEEHLYSLLTDQPTALASLAFACAREDSSARKQKISLFDGVVVPRSHYSWNSALRLEEQCEVLVSEKWPAVKMKGTCDVTATAALINEISERTRRAGWSVKLRVDFNSCTNLDNIQLFLSLLNETARRELDFLEDPVPYEESVWCELQQRYQLRLAVDKAWATATRGFDVVVVKPTRRDWKLVIQKHPQAQLVFTSAMDHPIGQSWAALQAARARSDLPSQVAVCGLCTQHLFQGDAFCSRLKTPSGYFQPDAVGGGLGFGDLIAELKWEKLSL